MSNATYLPPAPRGAERPIRITGLEACSWGRSRLEFIKGLVQQVMEEREGRAMEWVAEINIDALTLTYADDGSPVMAPNAGAAETQLLLAAP